MDKSFMGVPLPPDWSVTPDPESGLLILRDRGYPPLMGTSVEVTSRIAQYWRENPNEQHRKPGQAPRDIAPAQHTPGNAGGASQGTATAAPRPITLADYARQALIPCGIMRMPSNADLMADHYRMMAMLKNQMLYADLSEKPKAPLPRVAPVVGELIGHRAWKVEGGNLLRSYSAGSAWFPGQTMIDKTGKGQEIEDHNTAGTWAFKDPYELAHEFYSEIQSGGVFGTVWLWGTVIEHERGYRAQYASVRSLDRAGKGTDLEILRAAYLPKKTVEQ